MRKTLGWIFLFPFSTRICVLHCINFNLFRALTEEIFEDFCKELSQQLRIHKWKASNQIIFYLPWYASFILSLRNNRCDKLPNRSLKILASIITQYFPEVARITFNFAGYCL